jgi:hypothetical protein
MSCDKKCYIYIESMFSELYSSLLSELLRLSAVSRVLSESGDDSILQRTEGGCLRGVIWSVVSSSHLSSSTFSSSTFSGELKRLLMVILAIY